MLKTERLILRAFRADDAITFQSLAGEWDVARMTSDIPHPLGREQALDWLAPAAGETRFAIVREGELIGGAGYFRRASGAAEVGFWLGRAHWRRGYATEAVRALLVHGFASGERSFTSSHFTDNPASARVLAKLGFEATGAGRIFSVARREDVAATYYMLSRERAAGFMQLADAVPEVKSRWSALLDRFAGGGRQNPRRETETP